MKKVIIRTGLFLLIALLAACGSNAETDEVKVKLLKFNDGGFDSIKVHNYIAQTIIEAGYDLDTESVTGSTMATFQGIRQGDLHVSMEIWTENQKDMFEDALEAGEIVNLGTNFLDKGQGLYVPTYVIEGDPERGIEPIAPDLRTVEDLKDYPDIFEDPEDPGRGRILNGPSGWTVEEVITEKMDTYGLNETMNNFIPGSDSALVADLVSAYENGEPWVGYYWSPTWVTAKYDLTLLEEPEYDEEIWNENKGTAYPINDVVIVANKDIPELLPDVTEFLENYEMEVEILEDILQYIEEEDKTAEEAGHWFMEEFEDVWTEWVPEDIADKVKKVL